MNLEYLIKVIIPVWLIVLYSWFMILMVFDFILMFVEFDKDGASINKTELIKENEHDGK